MADDCYEWRSSVVERSMVENIAEVQIQVSLWKVMLHLGSMFTNRLCHNRRKTWMHKHNESFVNLHITFELLEELDNKRLAKQGRPEDGVVSSDTSSIASMIRDKIVVKASFPLSGVDRVNDPADFFKEVEALYQLKQAHEAKLTHREIEAARKVDDEYFAQFEKEKSPEHPKPKLVRQCQVFHDVSSTEPRSYLEDTWNNFLFVILPRCCYYGI